jgi:hypothetical protein
MEHFMNSRSSNFWRPHSAAVGLGLLLALVPAIAFAQTPDNVEDRKVPMIEVKVLVLNFDPIVVPDKKVRLHEYGRWQDPRVLAKGYAEDIETASGGRVRYRIVEWQDLDEFPVKTDGFVYTLEEYLRCHKAGKDWHQPDGADYPKVIAKYKLSERVDKGEIDEVWWFGGPYFGFFESAMAGRGAFYINGGVFGPDKVPGKRAFAIMGYNYERGVAEMIHNLCHRTESTMSRVFGGWKAEVLDSDWARFAANFKQSGGIAAVGTCHYPPNAESDYDYGNKRFVESSADDWFNYPKLTGTTRRVNCETWGGPDYHRNYMKWWFARLPRAPGVNKDNGRLNDWWQYVFHFNAYTEDGKAEGKGK